MVDQLFSELLSGPRRGWRMTINIKQFLSDDESDENARKVAGQIADLLQERHDDVLKEFGTAATEGLREIASSFRRSSDLEDVNYYLAELYDWADVHRVWLGL